MSTAYRDKTAVIHLQDDTKKVSVSYRQLNADVEFAYTRLVNMGATECTAVGVIAPNSYLWLLMDMTLIRLNALFVAFPVEFCNISAIQLQQEYGLNLLIISKTLPLRDIAAVPHIFIEDILNPERGAPVQIISANRSVERDISTLVFGSGTEGKIKCIKANFNNALSDFSVLREKLNVSSEDNVVVFLPLSVLQQRIMVYITLLNGATVTLLQPNQLMKGLQVAKPTVLVAPPLFYETMIQKFNDAVAHKGRFTAYIMRYLKKHESRNNIMAKLYYWLLSGPVRAAFGGRMRLMLVGMSMTKKSTLEYFQRVKLPLLEAYGLSEAGVISLNTPDCNRIGSVGQPIVPGAAYLADDGEIIVRREHLWTVGFTNVNADEAKKYYLSANEFATGDYGRFDEDGYLYIIGRKKQTISLSSGYKIQPEALEGIIGNLPGIHCAVAVGNALPFIIMILSLHPHIKHEEKQAIEQAIQAYNKSVVPRGRIGAFLFTDIIFTRENGFLNRNLKLDRSKINNHFSKQLQQLVEEKACEFEV